MKLTKALLCLSLAIDKRYLRHSIILPFNCETLKKQFVKFKRLVITDCVTNNIDIDESLFQLQDNLHLTICSVNVSTEQLRQRSIDTFIDCYHKHIKTHLKNNPFYLDIRGIGLLRGGDHSKAHVIYAKVESPSNQLQRIIKNITEEYSRAGLLGEESNYRKYWKPHITIMNTEYRNKYWHRHYVTFKLSEHFVSDLNENFVNEINKKHTRRPFDATLIFERYKDFVFCDQIVVNCIQLALKNVYYMNITISPYDNYGVNLCVNQNGNYNKLFPSHFN